MISKWLKKHQRPLVVILILFLALFLRTYRLDQSPPSPYWEEVALGYDAYSLLKTGKDHHGNPWPIVAIESFGDWKPAVYIYSLIPILWIGELFGASMNVVLVRLPAVFAGVAIVAGVGKLAYLILPKEKRWPVSVLSMLFTTVSMWALQFSRAAWEVNLAVALLLWGVNLFLLGINHKKHKQTLTLLVAITLLVLSSYTYHAARLIAPLFGLVLFHFWIKTTSSFKEFFSIHAKQLLILGLFGLVTFLPQLQTLSSPELSKRFNQTSIWSNFEVIEASNQLKLNSGNTFFGDILFHRYWLYGKLITRNFISHLDPKFLFVNGDYNPRHSIQTFGHLYYLDVVFLFVGLIAISKQKKRYPGLLGAWIFISLLPASLTLATPHALRALFILPVLMILLGTGCLEVYLWLASKFSKKLAMIGIAAPYLILVALYLNNYHILYPYNHSSSWQYGYEELYQKLIPLSLENPDMPIYIQRSQGRPAMYLWFYTMENPEEVQAMNSVGKRDQGEFLSYKQFRFFDFAGEISSDQDFILVTAPNFEEYKKLASKTELVVKNNQGKIVWQVHTIKL